jgi:hypothetical protein
MGLLCFKPFPRFRERFFLFRRDRLVVKRGFRDSAGHRISHYFEQMNNGGNLARSQSLDQIMGLLFFVDGCHKE